ncbi:MAG: kinase [Elusimicrobia bacterium CG11_big_fil_rev_8_21_14_0_20_64_6]|nr:MAG: kinase [Elusimicrobia bacterium CG11_big_fil_rev_8_21_14_0_20_64_6]
MIITRTPFRMSYFGGGTDYPAWFQKNGGAVLATTIDKYCYISCRYLPPFFEHKSRILYSKVECVDSNDQIEHPAVRGVLGQMGIKEGIEIHHDGDLPARTGLGSSSAFVVGLLNALSALKNTMPTKLDLAKAAINIEQNVLKENVGCQDQVITSFGGLQRVDFSRNDDIVVTPMVVSRERLEELQSHTLLFFTGFSRIASEIVKEQLQRIPEKTGELNRMYEMVDESIGILLSKNNLDGFGRLLDENWTLKRSLSSKVSLPAIDEIYEAAKSAGALGGKLLGAGGGGFMMLFAPPHTHAKIREKLKKLLYIPFRFDNEGSRIIYYQPNSYQGFSPPTKIVP